MRLLLYKWKRVITKADYRTIDNGYADCMLLSWGLIWKICNDSKILNSQMLLLVPIILVPIVTSVKEKLLHSQMLLLVPIILVPIVTSVNWEF